MRERTDEEIRTVEVHVPVIRLPKLPTGEVVELPHRQRVSELCDYLADHLYEHRAALTANQKDRKRLEDDIKVHEQKISKLKDQTLQAKTNEQYRAFQNEIDYAQREIRKCEESFDAFFELAPVSNVTIISGH